MWHWPIIYWWKWIVGDWHQNHNWDQECCLRQTQRFLYPIEHMVQLWWPAGKYSAEYQGQQVRLHGDVYPQFGEAFCVWRWYRTERSSVDCSVVVFINDAIESCCTNFVVLVVAATNKIVVSSELHKDTEQWYVCVGVQHVRFRGHEVCLGKKGVLEDNEKVLGTEERGEGEVMTPTCPELHTDCTIAVRPCHIKAREHIWVLYQ